MVEVENKKIPDEDFSHLKTRVGDVSQQCLQCFVRELGVRHGSNLRVCKLRINRAESVSFALIYQERHIAVPYKRDYQLLLSFVDISTP